MNDNNTPTTVSFEEWWDSRDVADWAKLKEYEEFASEAWYARDAEIEALLAEVKELSQDLLHFTENCLPCLACNSCGHVGEDFETVENHDGVGVAYCNECPKCKSIAVDVPSQVLFATRMRLASASAEAEAAKADLARLKAQNETLRDALLLYQKAARLELITSEDMEKDIRDASAGVVMWQPIVAEYKAELAARKALAPPSPSSGDVEKKGEVL